MKLKSLLVLLLAGIWGIGSWWWYTCKIKGFCGAERTTAQVAASTAAAGTALAAKSDDTTGAGSKEVDTDGDGLSDTQEAQMGLDPTKKDTDGDGIPDGVEMAKSLTQDTDGDGKIDALDDDDDGDGVLTKDENPTPNGDGNVAAAEDKNANGIPDYLDPSAKQVLQAGAISPSATQTADKGKSSNGSGSSSTPASGSSSAGDSAKVALNNSTADKVNKAAETAKENMDKAATVAKTAAEQTQASVEQAKAAADQAQAGTEQAKAAVEKAADNAQASTEQAANNAKLDAQAVADQAKAEAAKAKEEATKVTIETNPGAAADDIGPATLHFPTGSSSPELSADVKAYFTKVVKFLKDNPNAKVTIVGHTDNKGNSAKNKALGLKRAEILQKTLVTLGAPKGNITASSEGDAQPIADNNTEEGRKKNRRVEITPTK